MRRKLLGFGERHSSWLPNCSTTTSSSFPSLTASALPQGGVFTFGVGGEWTLPRWQTGAPQWRQTGLCKAGPDHWLAVPDSTQQHSTFSFVSPNSRALQKGQRHSITSTVSKPRFHIQDPCFLSSRDKITIWFSHYPPMQPLTVSHQRQRYWHCLLHLNSPWRAKPSLQHSESQNASKSLL